MAFELSSSVLSQYGNPATPSTIKDSTGSFLSGISHGMNLSNSFMANQRAEEQVELDKREQTRREDEQLRKAARDEDLKKREEETARLNQEKHDLQVEEFEAREATQKLNNQIAQFNLKRAKATLETDEEIKKSKDIIQSVIKEVELANIGKDATKEEIDEQIYQKLLMEHPGEVNYDLLATRRENAHAGRSNTHNRAELQQLTVRDALILSGSNDYLGAMDAVNSVMGPDDPPLTGWEELPPDNEPDGAMGWINMQHAGSDDWKPVSISRLTRGDEYFAVDKRQAQNAANNRIKGDVVQMQNEYKTALKNIEIRIQREDEDMKTFNLPIGENEGNEGVRFMSAYASDFLDSYSPDQREGVTDSIIRQARVFVRNGRGKFTKEEALFEAVEQVRDEQYKLKTGRDRPRYSAIKDFLGMHDYDDPVRAPLTGDATKDKATEFVAPEGTVPEKKPHQDPFKDMEQVTNPLILKGGGAVDKAAATARDVQRYKDLVKGGMTPEEAKAQIIKSRQTK